MTEKLSKMILHKAQTNTGKIWLYLGYNTKNNNEVKEILWKNPSVIRGISHYFSLTFFFIFFQVGNYVDCTVINFSTILGILGKKPQSCVKGKIIF